MSHITWYKISARSESLPFEAEQFDLVVYNASLHYSTDYAKILGEGLRVLKSRAQIVIMDSPIYQNVSSGKQMLEEHQKYFLENFGRVVDALPSRGYLTWEQLDQLATWKWIEPDYGLRWKLRRWGAALLGRREPARFGILITEPLRHKGTLRHQGEGEWYTPLGDRLLLVSVDSAFYALQQVTLKGSNTEVQRTHALATHRVFGDIQLSAKLDHFARVENVDQVLLVDVP